MTSDSLPRSRPDVHQQDIQKAKCDVTFTLDEAYVVVERPTNDADKERYTSVHRQYLLRIPASPPKTFNCEISGKMLCPSTKVILQKAMLEKLPLLLDISQSPSSKQQAAAQLELPCSVWGFVSLLLLLEGNVKLAHWFQGNSDTSLPTQTLLV
jgi:hypothetical protein